MSTQKPKKIEELEALYNTTTGEEKLKWAVEYCTKLKQSNLDKAITVYYEALPLANELNNIDALIQLHKQAGIAKMYLTKYIDAIELFNKALYSSKQINNIAEIAECNANLGMVYQTIGDFEKALLFMKEALSQHELIDNKKGICIVTGNLGIMYYSLKNYSMSLKYLTMAYEISLSENIERSLAINIANLGELYMTMGEEDKAIEYFERAQAVHEKVGNIIGASINLNNCAFYYAHKSQFDKANEMHQQALANYQKINNTDGIITTLIYQATTHRKNNQLVAASKCVEEANALLQTLEYNPIQMANLLGEWYQINELEGDFNAAFIHLKKCKEIENELRDEEIQHKASNLDAQRSMELIEKEKEITSKILHNILPASIVNRIRNGEEKIIQRFDKASVLFADIVGFTQWSKNRDVNEVADRLDALFQLFDAIAMKLQVEKIKTIGDCYMCVCGLPETCNDHEYRLTQMAVEMLASIDKQFSKADDIQLRIGIHSGEVIAGILGTNKYAYDVWGDTVNTASRMESHGIANAIQVSEDVFAAINDKFAFEYRGEIEIKSKGKMKTYLLKK